MILDNNKCSAVAEMGDRLATIDMGRKLGGLCPFGGAGSTFNTMWPGPRPTFVPSGILIHPAVWPQQTWAENWGGLCPFWRELGPQSPSNTTLPGPRPTCVPSFILIHPTVWPKYTNVTDRQTDTQTDSTDRTSVRQDRANRFANGREKKQ